mmetsp:Transcript_40582/g.95293  ORF Transcript_40582/g.95293 Transcript_40582/m.95293 type:complete len:155 (+) Transcript_40582:174-638(+)|eukprot:CAMPEP_0113317260 /NCGR_PEP_ID=MMETSP0010_2-20120614/12230_1 /TAXON_ID=216773 ORGANISM="Corethron hystrix, Strain 308" /NCGR_SAMPLE_ID=MMETSP0010_2 /ASSEMBLY_ACC=CAM_ASM_000155 /LENGTH=154 /DNA_ID=CAMNT_0000174187 /DNA_START=155 /DNA_END=619 /DNA_ORIENTATION=- /assembly_acc=CAM_ASM_000155
MNKSKVSATIERYASGQGNDETIRKLARKNDDDDSNGTSASHICPSPIHELNPSLARKLLALPRSCKDDQITITVVGGNDENGKPEVISDGAAVLIAELLIHFVSCGARLAAVEAECDHEANISVGNNDNDEGIITVRSEHVRRVAAELLMDFA